MNQTESYLQIPYRLEEEAGVRAALPAAPRLIVVVTKVQNEALLASSIASLTQPHAWPVVLAGIALNPEEEATLRRRLVTVAAFLRDRILPASSSRIVGMQSGNVEIHMEHGRSWLGNIKRLLLPEDLLACSEDETVGIPARPLNDVLSSALDTTLYTLSSLNPVVETRPGLLSQALPWICSLVSIGGFLALQARIVTTTQGALQTMLLLVSLFGEVGVIWILNSWFGQA